MKFYYNCFLLGTFFPRIFCQELVTNVSVDSYPEITNNTREPRFFFISQLSPTKPNYSSLDTTPPPTREPELPTQPPVIHYHRQPPTLIETTPEPTRAPTPPYHRQPPTFIETTPEPTRAPTPPYHRQPPTFIETIPEPTRAPTPPYLRQPPMLIETTPEPPRAPTPLPPSYQTTPAPQYHHTPANTFYQTSPEPPRNPTSPPTHYQKAPEPQPRYDSATATLMTNNCRKAEKVVLVEQCEPYTVETCWTEPKEECAPKILRKCTGAVETSIEEVCFNVEEDLCKLVESIGYERAEDNYQVQECFFGYMDSVCGTEFDIETFEKDDYQCIDVDVLNCYQEENYINDVKCVYSSTFDCKLVNMKNSYGREVVCSEKPKRDCFSVPRKVHTEVCKISVERQCEMFSFLHPMPVERKKCKPFTKKMCDFQVKSIPKIAKKFSYTKECQQKERIICDHIEKKEVKAKCETTEIMSCEYIPREQCKYDPDMYCHEVEKVVVEEDCSNQYDTNYAI